MEFLIVLIVLVILGFVAAGWGGFALFGQGERKQKQHEESADEALDHLFDGSQTVVYSAPDHSGGLSMETLVRGANDHGYRFVSETGRMATRKVVFERVP